MKKLRQTISKGLSEARLARDLSQSELASRAGLLPSAVAHFESGRRMPGVANLLKLADALDISLDRLFGRDRGTPTGRQAGKNTRVRAGRSRKQK